MKNHYPYSDNSLNFITYPTQITHVCLPAKHKTLEIQMQGTPQAFRSTLERVASGTSSSWLRNTNNWVVVSSTFHFHPYFWGRWSHFDSYFSDGLVQPPTSKTTCGRVWKKKWRLTLKLTFSHFFVLENWWLEDELFFWDGLDSGARLVLGRVPSAFQ